MPASATFFTVSNAAFFAGTVGLLNSLRLTGHREPIVVLDAGLNAAQRERLAPHTTLVEVPADVPPTTLKPFALRGGASGTIALIDSDILVTGSLAPTLALADRGKICLYPDPAIDRGRWFADWEGAFSLATPPRHQLYLNAGFVAFSVAHWPDLLERWSKACSVIPADRVFTEEDQLFRDGDQDALNAILMSEVELDALAILPEYGEVFGNDSDEAVIVDEHRLVCLNRGEPVVLVHQTMQPKVWGPCGWRRIRRWPEDLFTRLLPRALLAEDVELRLRSDEVPWWLRPTAGRKLGVAAIRAYARSRRRARLIVDRLRATVTSPSR